MHFLHGYGLKSVVDAIRFGACSALVLISCNFPAWAESTYLCYFDELMVCGEGIGCSSEGSEIIDTPRRIKIDVAGGNLSSLDDVGNLQEATAKIIEQQDGVYFFQAIQRSRPEGSNVVGWTIFLNTKSMKISGSVVNADIVLNGFGNCENQSD